MKRKDLIKKLKKNGWKPLREGGSHTIYYKGKRRAVITRHKEINGTLAKNIISKLGLK